MVVQFGLATIPFGIDARASSLTSGTTRGTSGSIRHAEELSITIAPAAAKRGASSREPGAPQENRAMSSPAGSAAAASSTVNSSPPKGSRRPAERAEANNRSSIEREVPLLQDGAHHAAHLPGRADHPDSHAVQSTSVGRTYGGHTRSDQGARRSPAQDSSKAACSARTASSTALGTDHAGDPDGRGRDHLDVDAVRRPGSRRSVR